jgi:hypothetical protein
METPENFLNTIEFLPDGTSTANQHVWLKAWGEYIGKQFIKGKINLYDVDGFNEETGEVPNAFILKVYQEQRKSH